MCTTSRLGFALPISALALFVLAQLTYAVDFCVDSSSALQTALTSAATNGQADRLLVVQGTYTGPFVYTSSERYALQVLGGYVASCATRTLDSANTQLIGSGTDRVLSFTTTNGGAFTLEGVTISGGIFTGDGGGLYVSTINDISLRDNLFTNNWASVKGGGAYIASEGTMYVERNTFANNGGNYKTSEGSGIYVFTDHGSLAMSDNNFTANLAVSYGGGASLYTNLGTLTLTRNNWDGNRLNAGSSYNQGGGVRIIVQSNGVAILTGNSFSSNQLGCTYGCDGGGAYVNGSSGSAILTDNSFINNIRGSAARVIMSTGTATLTGNRFNNNTANYYGGGAYASTSSGAVILGDNEFFNNITGSNGGGAYVVTATGAATLNGNVFNTNNGPHGGGAAVATTQGVVTLTNNTFFNNAGSVDGGGLWLAVSSEVPTTSIYNNLFWSNAAPVGRDFSINNDNNNNGLASPLTLLNNDFNQNASTGFWTKIAIAIDPSNLNAVNPLFADDFQHLSAASALIDAGNNAAPALPATDMDGQPRVIGAAVDIGADEYVPLIDQTITFDPAPTIIIGGIGTVTATGGASGNPVIFTSQTTGVCTSSGTNGSTITGVTAGTCTIAANQAGNATYNPAPQVTQSFSIGLIDQTIAFGPAPTIVVGGTGTVTATGGASGNPVIFTSQTPGACASGGTNGVTITGVTAGTCTIAANQAGNANYNPAPQATQSFSIGKANQTIAFGPAPTIVVGGTGMVTATGGASGNPVIFTTQTASVCTSGGTNGATITGVTAGTCTIAANQAGNTNYNPAPQATQSFSIGKADQTIAFGAAPTIVVGGTGTVTATGGASGNPVIFTSQTAGVCTSGYSNGSTITGVTAGTCTIAANQDGNTNYNPAAQATQSFRIGNAVKTTLFSDSFDSYAAGAFPSSVWTLRYNGSGSPNQYVDTAQFTSPGQSLRLQGSSCWSANAYHPVTLPSTPGTHITLSAKVYMDQIVSGGCSNDRAWVALEDPTVGTWGAHYAAVAFDGDGFVYALQKEADRTRDVKLMAYQAGGWYLVETNIDLVARTFDVYIDGTLKAQGLQILDTGLPTGVEMCAGHGNNPTVWFDDISLDQIDSNVPRFCLQCLPNRGGWRSILH
ncbi:right-handed parallel beta-helix repeat-containing protein [uncultured Thiodictyon sp.]|uniref:beta strand repeat-containing protein n=1 Tax=uncultured Thiodictyon sp. TaxID=1846217 RepID=UPI0025F1FDDB|nr:right-handed parallel beta-helix repeat-containing protein [uncultured Thiodictyon sp.]